MSGTSSASIWAISGVGHVVSGMPRNWQHHVQAKQQHRSSLHASSPLGISPGTQSLRRTGRRRVPSGRSPRFFSVASHPPEPAAAICPKQGTGTQQPQREAPCQSLGRLPCSHTTPPKPYRAAFPARQNPHPTTRRPQRTATGDPSTTSAEYGSLRLAAKDSP